MGGFVLLLAVEVLQLAGERFWEAEIHRLKGELLLLDGDGKGAHDCFQKALEVAHSQGARSLELRATTSLARLYLDTNGQEDARSLLFPIYDGFTEGLDTADLQEAKAILDRSQHPVS